MRLIHSSTKPWVGQFRATTANPRGLMKKRWKNAHLGGFEGENWRRTCGFKDFVRFLLFFGKMLEYRVFLKVESEDASVMLTQYYRGVFITCTLKQMFEKSNGMHPCFERNSRFWCLNHVVLSLFRRTYVQSLSLHFLKEKECVFASFREIISICSEKVKKIEVKKVFSIFAKIKI